MFQVYQDLYHKTIKCIFNRAYDWLASFVEEVLTITGQPVVLLDSMSKL